MPAEQRTIALEPKLYEAISKLANETNRTRGGMIREMFEAYIRAIPVIGRVSDDRVTFSNTTGSE